MYTKGILVAVFPSSRALDFATYIFNGVVVVERKEHVDHFSVAIIRWKENSFLVFCGIFFFSLWDIKCSTFPPPKNCLEESSTFKLQVNAQETVKVALMHVWFLVTQ